MADGGLLKKAMEQKTEDVIEADIKFESDVKSSENLLSKLGSNGMKLGLFLALIGLISGFITANPQLQQEYSLAIFLPISILSASFFFLWTSLDRKMTGVIAVFCVLLLATPYGITSLNSSSLTIVDDELSG
jgi:Ca2+/Na+ antiporter